MRHLLADVAAGRLTTGDRLPREVDLAARFDVSRGVARDTIQALRERGLVEVRHGSGARLRSEDEWDLLDEEVLAALVPRPERADLRAELLECLLRLEPDAAALAAGRAQAPEIEALQAALEAMRAAGEAPALGFVTELAPVTSQVAFHDRLLAASRNRPLRQMLRPVHTGIALTTHLALTRRQRAKLVDGHADVLAAVRAHDADRARTTLETLLRQLGRRIAVLDGTSRRRSASGAARSG